MSWTSGLWPPVLVADSGYGEVGEFRQGLDDRGIGYVVQAKADTSAYPEQVRPTTAPYAARGRRPRARYRDKPTSLKQLTLQPGSRPVRADLAAGRRGLQRSHFLSGVAGPPGRGHPRRQAAARAGSLGWEPPVWWLLVEWAADKVEPVKYWLSNLPATTPLVELVRLARLHWRVEMVFPQLTKGWVWAVG
jgi:DDE superfamily endonuclease